MLLTFSNEFQTHLFIFVAETTNLLEKLSKFLLVLELYNVCKICNFS
jgi:hypothetical protein